jgi:hypothetical protein
MGKLNKLIASCLLIFVWTSSYSQKAEIMKLEDFNQPEVDLQNYKVWKNEGLLIPIRFTTNDLQDWTLTTDLPDAGFSIETFKLHWVSADYSAGACGEAKSAGSFRITKTPDRAELIADFPAKQDSLIQWILMRVVVKSNAKSGIVPLNITLKRGSKTFKLSRQIAVLDRKLADLSEINFVTDYWQFPMAVADYYQVQPWSSAHWNYLDTMFNQLKGINQHSITTFVFWDLYNTRIRPLDEMMIKIKKNANGQFSYDFSVFEEYVKRAMASGIEGQISVHNLFPWNQFAFYQDEASGNMVSHNLAPGSDSYKSFWEPFLNEFSTFLKRKNWMDKTIFFVDERDAGQTLELVNWVKSIDSRFKFGFSGRFYPSLSEVMEEYSTPMNVVIDPSEMSQRILSDKLTTLYTSCYEQSNQPNNLVLSDYRNTYFLALLSKSKGYNGMLRWAFNLWSSDIMTSAIYGDVPSGDAHFVYPEQQLSVRYLVLQDAIEEIGKLETKSKLQNSEQFYASLNRYFLINIEADRYATVNMMKDYLND